MVIWIRFILLLDELCKVETTLNGYKKINNMNRRYCLALDLKDEPELIESYKKYHRPENFRPEITASIKESGIVNMEIYLTGNRLFMIMEVDEDFNFQNKVKNGF